MGPKNVRKKHNIAKVQISLAISIYFFNRLFDVSSKENWCCIYQIETLIKTFIFHIVSKSGILACVLQVQGTSF